MKNVPEYQPDTQPVAVEGSDWVKPRIESFLPAKAAEGVAYNPADGFSNLTA